MHKASSPRLASKPGKGWLALVAALCTIVVAFGVFSDVSPAYAASSQRSTQISQYIAHWQINNGAEATAGHIVFYNHQVKIGGDVSSTDPGVCAEVDFLPNKGTPASRSSWTQGSCEGDRTFGFYLSADALNTSHVTVVLGDTRQLGESVLQICYPTSVNCQ